MSETFLGSVKGTDFSIELHEIDHRSLEVDLLIFGSESISLNLDQVRSLSFFLKKAEQRLMYRKEQEILAKNLSFLFD